MSTDMDTGKPNIFALLVGISVTFSILTVLIALLVLLLYGGASLLAPLSQGLPGSIHYFIRMVDNFIGAFGALFLVFPFAIVNFIIGILLQREGIGGQKKVGLSGIVLGALGMLMCLWLLTACLIDLSTGF